MTTLEPVPARRHEDPPRSRSARRRIAGVTRPSLAALLVCLLVLGVVSAQAHDSEAPPTAGHFWLPCDDWVMFHWPPYDERKLFPALGGRRRAEVWLRDHTHTLAQLAQRRGLDPTRLADRLVRPWRGRVSPAWYAELRRRSRRSLSQGHLARHLFFHPYDQPAVAARARRIFGIDPLELQRLLPRGRSLVDVGRTRGLSQAAVVARVIPVLRATARRGVRERAVPPAQAWRSFRRQRAGVSRLRYVRFRHRSPDHTQPHPRPTTRRELLCYLFQRRIR